MWQPLRLVWKINTTPRVITRTRSPNLPTCLLLPKVLITSTKKVEPINLNTLRPVTTKATGEKPVGLKMTKSKSLLFRNLISPTDTGRFEWGDEGQNKIEAASGHHHGQRLGLEDDVGGGGDSRRVRRVV